MIFDSFDEIFFLMYIHWEKNNTLKTAYFDFLQIWGDTDWGGGLQNRAPKYFKTQRTRKFAVLIFYPR